jgi:hypothetical protein
LQLLHGAPLTGVPGDFHLLKYRLSPDSIINGENKVEIKLAQPNKCLTCNIEMLNVEVNIKYRDLPIKVQKTL